MQLQLKFFFPDAVAVEILVPLKLDAVSVAVEILSDSQVFQLHLA